ncbi:hypothetical protein FB45DRAFT_1065672 [Roridomyces roridus]|uniref:Uncharacterized protein n=1 Tax=Roridomyces roridus TaxID=1738132 RepID=A0AAD7FA36_9AGAR|nr:hypothetical protein FB45DRAFT_1065672 [Roridomyces roridus]
MNRALHKKRESVSATLQSFVSNHHLLLGSRTPRSSPLVPRSLAIRAHWLPLLLPSPPLLDVCIGLPALPFLAFVTVAPSTRLSPSPPLLGVCIGEDPFHWCLTVPPRHTPPRLAAASPTRHPIHGNHIAIPQYIHSPRATSPPRLANPDSSSVKTLVSLRARWMDPASTDRLAVAPASSLRPCLAGFTSSNTNSISSLHLKFGTQYVKNPMSLRARWMGPVLTDRLGHSNLSPRRLHCVFASLAFTPSSWPPLDLTPFTVGSWVRQDGIQSVSDSVDTAACEMDGRSWDG